MQITHASKHTIEATSSEPLVMPRNTLIPPTELTLEQYHACEGSSSSFLKHFSRTPWHALWAKSHPQPSTEPQLLGSLLHLALLEPDRFNEQVKVMPAYKGVGKTAKEQLVRDANPGATLISQSCADLLELGYEAVMQHATAKGLLTNPKGIREHSFFWEDKATGLLLKARPDLFIPGEKVIVVADLKKALDASVSGFSLQATKLQYHLSAALYIEALEQIYPRHDIVWFWIPVEMETKQCAVYALTPEDLAKGKQALTKAKLSLKQCLLTNQWPGYQPDGQAQPLSLRSWA